MHYYLHKAYHSLSKEPAMHYDDYNPPLLLPVSNKNRRYSHTFRTALIMINPAKDKIRLFDVATKKVKYKGMHDYVWILNNS